MPSTFTDILRLELQADGENENTWGQKLNEVVDKLETGIAGRKAITLGASDVTLTTNNGGDGDDEQAAAMILDLTGALSANVNIVAPNKSKIYLIRNGCTQTASETVSIKTADGDALEIPNGSAFFAWCNGSDVFRGAANDASGLTSGTLSDDRLSANVLTPSVIAALTALDISGLDATDGIYIDDAGTAKRMAIQDMGVRVVDLSTTQTFALVDANSLQVLTGSTNRVWTIPANATVPFKIGAILYVAARDTAKITVTAASGVTLTSAFASGVAGSIDVVPGGTAAFVKVATNEWMANGDIVPA
jgi:hypothetical protein